MELTAALAAALGTSWASGINLYAAVATLGILRYFGYIDDLPGDLDDVAKNPAVMIVAVVMYCIEFVADKIPYVDTCWDVVHTFIRIPAGAALAVASFTNLEPVPRALLILLGGGIALSSHASKAATRVAINTSPEPFTNSIASLGEDSLAFGVVFLAIRYPITAIFVVVSILALTIYLLPKIVRLIIAMFRRIAS